MRNGVIAGYYIRNFLNRLNPNTEIYKYIPVEYICEMKRSRHMRFDLVNKWEDVYENYFLKQNFINEGGSPVSTENISNAIYGQCWTMQKESDAMWRIYSSEKNAVKVKTTAGRLMDVLYTDDSCMASTFIGRVDYLPQLEIEAEYQNLEHHKISISSFGGSQGINNFIKESLITKREEFAHEREVRIIKIEETNGQTPQYIEAPFDPDLFFDEFIIDPRVSQSEEEDIRNRLISYGVDQGKIGKSHLYDLKTYTLIV